MKYLFFVLTICHLTAQAQNNLFRINKVPFIKNGKELAMPFTKGIANPQFSEIDINLDGKKDLFIFERMNNEASIFINTKDSGKISYQYSSKYSQVFPNDIYNWALLRDYNCDGIEDIFAYTPGGIKVYKAVLKNGEISFVKTSDLLYAENYSNWPGRVNIWSAYDDMPAIVDIDGDGDLDIMAIMLGENALSMYKSVTKDSAWSCDSLRFKYQARCWGKFAMMFSNFDIIENACGGDTIDFNPIPKDQTKLRDGGNTFWVFDEDKDGDFEILAGDVVFNNAIYGKNIGTNKMARITQKSTSFPSYSNAINELFPMGYILDVNNDGNKDMIINSHSFRYNGFPKNIHYYKNVPKGDTSKFMYHQNNFLIDQILDKGKMAKPLLFNYNNDSLMDFLIGNDMYCDTIGKCNSSVTLYKNIGTKTIPKFEWVTDDFANLKKWDIENMNLTFGDLDNDGNQDLIIGDIYGKLHYFKNVVNGNGAASFPNIDTNINPGKLGNYCAPFLVDMNGDSLLDLLIGHELHKIIYIKNIGTKTNFIFDYANSNNFLGNIDTRKIGDIEFPKNKPFVRLDDSTKMPYLYVSTLEGKVFVYKINKDSLNSGTFESITKNLLTNTYTEEIAIALGDINADNKTDIFIGNRVGGIQLFSYGAFDIKIDTNVISNIGSKKNIPIKYRVYPNPVTDFVYIESDQSNNFHSGEIVITDVVGTRLLRYTMDSNHSKIDLGFLNAGVYFIDVKSTSQSSAPLIKIIKY